MADVTHPELGMAFNTSESIEKPTLNTNTWLGAGLEVGGGIFFDVSNVKSGGKIYTYSYPLVTIGNSDPNKAHLLKDTFGGYVVKRSDKNSWYWTLKGAKVVDLLSDAKTSAPSRRDIINAMESWAEVGSREEKLEIAREFQADQIRTPVLEEHYDMLLEDPNFIAGVIENRGSVYQYERYFPTKGVGNVSSGLEIQSVNKELLAAFNRKFGGKLYIVKNEGQVKSIKGEQFTLQNDSVVLKIGEKEMKRIMHLVQPYLLFVWDTSKPA